MRFGIIVVALMCWASPGLARDDGRYQNSDPGLKAWVKQLTDKNGNGCCDTADGYPAEVEWDSDTVVTACASTANGMTCRATP